ncbi:MAG: flagellar biosynthesis regulator FlaF [Rhodospirillaceae bacterium]
MSPPPRSNPYSNVPTAAADPRQVEGWALTETAVRMKAAQQEPVDEAVLLHAARLNWRLWTIFQASLLEPDCPVPTEIRNNILSLSNFVDKHTAGIIAEPRADKLDVLIRINRELAGGLMTVPPTPAAAKAPGPAPAAVPHRPMNTRA